MLKINLLLESIVSKIKVFILQRSGANIGRRVKLCRYVHIPRLSKQLQIADGCSIDRYVSFVLTHDKKQPLPKVILGENVYINRFTLLDASLNITVGAETMIGPHCYITDHDHEFQSYPPEHPIGQLPVSGKATTIGDNVWLGSHVTVLKGISIGNNTIVGAGSIVTKSLPDNVVAVGNPCKVIKQRS